MVADVVVVGIVRPTVTRLLRNAGVTADWASMPLRDGTVSPRTLAVFTHAEHGAVLAQAVHAVAPDAAVVFLADDDAQRADLESSLMITPGIGRHTLCLRADDDGGEAVVADEIDAARRRITHRATLAALPVGAAKDGMPSERLSDYLAHLFDHAPVCILVVDAGGVIRAANPSCVQTLGWQPQHTLGMTFAAMFGGHDQSIPADLLTDCLTSGDAATETIARTGPDGGVQHVEATVTPINPKRLDLGVFVMLRDETARVRTIKATERALQAAEQSALKYAGLAWTLQESLLPPELPHVEGAEIAARFHPAGDGSEIGGDFYDVFQVPGVEGEEWYAVMGDVCGKGAGAARLTALTRYSLRGTAARTRSIERNLADLNATLCRQYEQDHERGENRFVTATMLRFTTHPDGGLHVHAGSGGHAPPLIVSADGTVEPIPCRGPLLGVFDTGAWSTATLRLEPGDLVVAYTDGVTEAQRGDEHFGDDRLVELLRRNAGRPADDVASAIEDAVLRFQSGNARDDIAILVLQATNHT